MRKTFAFIVSVLFHQCLSDLYGIDFFGVAFLGHNLLETPALLNKESSKYDIMCFSLSSEDCVDTFIVSVIKSFRFFPPDVRFGMPAQTEAGL